MTEKKKFEQPAITSESVESLSAKLLDATAKLAETNKELERLQKERSEMLANLSHDLRAPLTAIRSTVDYLNSGKVLSPEEFQSAVQIIDRRTKTLEKLIQDMYYLFCIEDTSRELTLENVDAALFLEEYFYDATVDKRYDSHLMKLDIPEDLQCQISVDLQKMIRVLDNLMTNAAKYSGEHSTITLKASARMSGSVSSLCISVIDNGPGIPAEALPHIFNRTFTLSLARTPDVDSGSGLGLSIVKAIVERHGGTISCNSTLGEGSCFTISLPACLKRNITEGKEKKK